MGAGEGLHDSVPFGLLLLAFLLMLSDGIDMAAMPLAVPHIALALHREPATFGLALSAMALGFGIGALLIGPSGDRYGRRPLIIGMMLLVALATGATGLSTSMAGFVLCRLAVGIGLGGCLTNLNALVAERVPSRFRARALTLMSTGIPLGAAAIGFFMPPLIDLATGWRGAFYLLGFALLVVAGANALWLPESQAVLARPGHLGNAPERLALLKPLGGVFRLTTIVFVSLYTLNACALYLLLSWLPTILPQSGYGLAAASRLTGTAQIGGLIGGLIISTFLDRSAAVPALTICYTIVTAALIGFQFLPPGGSAWIALLLFVVGGISAAHLAIMALGAISYPPTMTAAALGLAVAVARLGAVGGPLYGQWLLESGIDAPRFFLALFPLVLICTGCVFLVPRFQRPQA